MNKQTKRVFCMLLAGILMPGAIYATSGSMVLTVDTTLTEDHFGPIALSVDNITLDCDGFTVTATAIYAVISIDSHDGGTIRNCVVAATGATFGISIQFSDDHTVSNNTISGGVAGINVLNSSRNLVENNVATGASQGIQFSDGSDNVFVGNLVRDHTNVGFLLGASSGMHLLEGNTITANAVDGIRVNGGSGFTFFSNFIFDNGGSGTGIHFVGGGGVNDPMDIDVGSNDLQNFPDLSTVVAGNSTVVSGALNSTPSSTFTVEFFDNSACDPSGTGEGESPLGMLDVSTDLMGDASFVAVLPTGILLGNAVTATATDNATHNTSRFSSCVTTVSPQDLLQPICADVEALVAAGELNAGQGNSLCKKLDHVSQRLDAGNNNAALGILNAFVNQVSAYVNNGTLSAGDGQALIDAVNAVIASLS